MPNRTKTDHYRDITRPELEELYYYLSNPETDTEIAMQDIAKEYDAIYLGIGTTVSRSTKVKNIDRAHLALPFLQEN